MLKLHKKLDKQGSGVLAGINKGLGLYEYTPHKSSKYNGTWEADKGRFRIWLNCY